MMRYVFFTLLGFFGPALLMLFFRLLWYRIRYLWTTHKHEQEIIDITPKKPSGYPSRIYIVLWIVISLACTGLFIWQMDTAPAKQENYIPAHIDAQGNFVPAQMIEENNLKE